MNLSPDLENLVSIALEAGREIMEVYRTGADVRSKSDLSPVTDADIRAEEIILRGIKLRWPKVPVIAEESVARGQVPDVDAEFFLVDPLDGTREFITRNGQFTVNIARIVNREPVAGVVLAPALGKIWWGSRADGSAVAAIGDGLGKFDWTCCKVRSVSAEERTVVASRSHRDEKTEAYLKSVDHGSVKSIGSSLKFCLIAEAEADLYPRFGRTMEWDTAAGHAVLAAAGGHVRTLDGHELTYGKSKGGFENPAFIASAS